MTPILLNKLEPGCKYPYTDDTDFKKKFTEMFDRDCKDKANCTITLEKSDWPAACQTRMGDVSTQVSSSSTEADSKAALDAIKNNQDSAILHYAKFICHYPREGKLSEESLAKRIVGIDAFIMYCFLISLTVVTYIVNIDAENHRD